MMTGTYWDHDAMEGKYEALRDGITEDLGTTTNSTFGFQQIRWN